MDLFLCKSSARSPYSHVQIVSVIDLLLWCHCSKTPGVCGSADRSLSLVSRWGKKGNQVFWKRRQKHERRRLDLSVWLGSSSPSSYSLSSYPSCTYHSSTPFFTSSASHFCTSSSTPPYFTPFSSVHSPHLPVFLSPLLPLLLPFHLLLLFLLQ